MTTHTNKAASPREELARIIDPDAWTRYDAYVVKVAASPIEDQPGLAPHGNSFTRQSLARADEWLSRHPVKAASPEREAAITRVAALASAAKAKAEWHEEEGRGSAADLQRSEQRLWEGVLSALSLPVQSVEGIATAYYDGFVDGIMRQPWEDAADWAAIQGQAYAKTGERPLFIPVMTAPTADDLVRRLRSAAAAFAREFPQYGGGIYEEAAQAIAAPPKPSEVPAGQEYETALRTLTEMDAENMPIEKRAAILGSMIARLNDADRAWAAKMAKGLPEAPAMGWALMAALEGFDDDYMTSETHHPGYVLIPTDKFERIQAALAASTPESAGQSLGDACEFCDKPLPHDKCRRQPALGEREILPQDVIDLVIAAREVAFGPNPTAGIDALDKASEAFASRVPWEGEPALSTTTSTKGME